MDKATEDYYSNYFMLFKQEGWRQLLEELNANAQHINSVENTTDEEDLYKRKGQLQVIATLLNFEATIERSFEELQQDANI